MNDLNEIMRKELMKWLSKKGIRYTTNANKTSIFVLFHGGSYVRVTDFNTKTGLFYVKDDGIVSWMSPFELIDLILKYQGTDDVVDKFYEYMKDHLNEKEN